jgi:hypothetical protein
MVQNSIFNFEIHENYEHELEMEQMGECANCERNNFANMM